MILNLVPGAALGAAAGIGNALLDPFELERAAPLPGRDRRKQQGEPFRAGGRHPFFGFALRRGRVELRLPCGNLGGVLP